MSGPASRPRSHATRWAARAEALASALDQARARAGAEQLREVDGVVGTLLDLVEIDAGWEVAFEAAAGEALAAVVVRASSRPGAPSTSSMPAAARVPCWPSARRCRPRHRRRWASRCAATSRAASPTWPGCSTGCSVPRWSSTAWAAAARRRAGPSRRHRRDQGRRPVRAARLARRRAGTGATGAALEEARAKAAAAATELGRAADALAAAASRPQSAQRRRGRAGPPARRHRRPVRRGLRAAGPDRRPSAESWPARPTRGRRRRRGAGAAGRGSGRGWPSWRRCCPGWRPTSWPRPSSSGPPARS